MADKLTPKQEKFCKEYLVDLNGAQAAIRSGYSEHTAKEIASENLTKPNIVARIGQLRVELEEKTDLTPIKVLKELQNWAFGDFTEFMELSTEEIRALPDEIRRLIVGFEKTTRTLTRPVDDDSEVDIEETKLKVQFVNKERAMDMINKHLGFYEQKKKETEKKQEEATLKETELKIKKLEQELGIND